MDESIGTLMTKVKALAAVNNGIIETIEVSKDIPGKMVVTGWTHTLKLVLSKECGEPAAKVESTATITPIGPRIDGWLFHGEPLDIPEDVFNDNLDYDVKTFEDVKTLNSNLVRVAKKYTRFSDVQANRSDLRTFLTNLERLQVALGQIQSLTMDLEDVVSDDPSIAEATSFFTKGVECLSKTFDDHRLEVNARCAKGETELIGVARRVFDKETALRELKPLGVTSLDVTRLDLRRRRLTNIPDTIGSLTNLKELSLSENRLTSIPDTLGSLANLERLSLRDNRLTSIPDTIWSFMNLEKLYLHENKLKNIPESIGSLTNLSQLWLRKNQIRSIPDTIGSLKKLTYLGLNGNRLTGLPDTIRSLTNLTELWLRDQKSGVKLSRPPVPSSCKVLL